MSLYRTSSRMAIAVGLTLEPTQPLVQIVPDVLSPAVKRKGREADHSPPSRAEIKKCEAIPPPPHMSS